MGFFLVGWFYFVGFLDIGGCLDWTFLVGSFSKSEISFGYNHQTSSRMVCSDTMLWILGREMLTER